MKYSEFQNEGKETIELLNKMASFALQLGDQKAYDHLIKAKEELKKAGSSINAFVAFN